jgi:serine phosphatase RsbU (regulator of sigma subunit)
MPANLKSSRFSRLAFLAAGLAVFLLVGFLLWAGFTAPLNSRLPVPTPDGKYFAYFNPATPSDPEAGGGFDLIVSTPEGRQLGRFRMEVGTIHWSNAGHLALVDARRSQATLVANSGERLLVLTQLDLSPGTEPRWSRDGTKLAFVRPGSSRSEPDQLAVFDIQQPQALRVPLPAEFHLRQPVLLSWSPAGEELLILNAEGQEVVLDKIGTISGQVQELARGLASDRRRLPQLSPDGARVFLPPPQNSVIDAQSGEVLWVLPAQSDALWQPWSGDGHSLYYFTAQDPTEVRAHDFVTPSDEVAASGVRPNGFFTPDGRTYFFRIPPRPSAGSSLPKWRQWGEESRGWYLVNRLTASPLPLGRVELWPWEQTLDGLVLAREDDYTRVHYGLYDPDARAVDRYTFPTEREDLRGAVRAHRLILTTVALYALLALVILGRRSASAPARSLYILLLLLMALASGQSSLATTIPTAQPLPYRISPQEIQQLGWWMESPLPQLLLRRIDFAATFLWALLPLAFLHLGVVFPPGNRFFASRKALQIPLYAVSFLPLVGVLMAPQAPGLMKNPLRYLLVVAGLAALATWVLSLRTNYRRPPERRSRDQIRWMLLAFGLAGAGGALTLLASGLAGVLPAQGTGHFFAAFPAATLAVTGWFAPLAAAYAVTASKPYSIHLLFRRVLRQTLMGLPPLILFIVLWAVAGWVVAGSLLARSPLAVILAVLLTVLAAMPFRGRLRLLAERTFYRSAFEFREGLMDFARSLPHLLDRETLVVQLQETLPKAMGTNWLCLFALDREAKKLRLLRGKKRLPTAAPAVEFDPEEEFCVYLLETARPFEVEVSPYRPELIPVLRSSADRLGKLQAAVVLALRRRHELLGLLVLGAKNSGEFYDAEDLELLSTVARETAVALENIEVFEEAARSRELRRELEEAAEVQAQLFPSVVPRLPGAQVVGSCIPARAAAGDYYDFLELPGGRVGLAVSDVSGKGISASLLMASVRALLRSQAATAGSPADLVREINRQLHASSHGAKYCTMFYGVYDAARRELEYVNAGHVPPLAVAGDDVQFLQPTGLPLGLFPEISHVSSRVTLAPGALLVVYSDGVTETCNARGENYGTDRLVSAVTRIRDGDVERIAARILADVREFEAGVPLDDDQTLVLLKVNSD